MLSDDGYVDYEQLERLKSSNMLRDFVAQQGGDWDHGQWEGFLAVVRAEGFTLHSDVVGSALEEEKTLYWKIRNGELRGEFKTSAPAVDDLIRDPVDELEKEELASPVVENVEAIEFDELPLEHRGTYVKEMLKKKI